MPQGYIRTHEGVGPEAEGGNIVKVEERRTRGDELFWALPQ